jgi:tripartite-type tricarboxylate transporter receptor subunit TctC
MVTRRQFVLAAGALSLAPSAFAQERLKQLTIVVGSPAGGTVDRLARMYADALKGGVANAAVVENRAGAGGIIAYEYVKNSRQKDGSLMFLSPAYPLTISPHVQKLPYDTLTDFTPVAVGARSGGMSYAVGPAVPAGIRTLQDYLKWCVDNPKSAVYGAQTGSSQHLLGAMLALNSKLKLENISYKGDAPVIQDLLGGHVAAGVLPITAALPLAKAGQIRVLGVATRGRSQFFPDVPTFESMGWKDMVFQDWIGFFAPAGTSPAAVRQINAALGEVAKSPEGQAIFAKLAFIPEVLGPEEFAEQVRVDYKRYAAAIERTGFRQTVEKAQGQK